MQVNSIDHRNYDFKDGLNSIFLTRLNRVVIVAGSNGAGKTRLLARIAKLKGFHPSISQHQLKLWHIDENTKEIKSPNRTTNGTSAEHVGAVLSDNNPTIGLRKFFSVKVADDFYWR